MRSPTVSLLALLMVVQETLSHPASFADENTSTRVLGDAMAVRSSGPASEKDSIAARFLGQDYGSVGIFSNDSCTGTPLGPQPSIHVNNDCHNVSPSGPARDPGSLLWLGVNWGSGVVNLKILKTYGTEDCSDHAGLLRKNEDEEETCMSFFAGGIVAVANGYDAGKDE